MGTGVLWICRRWPVGLWRSVLALALILALGSSATGAAGERKRLSPKNVTWHGGPVQRRPRVYLIFWGPKWRTDAAHRQVRSYVIATIDMLRGSSYQRLLTQYYDSAGHVTGDVRLAGVWHDPSTPHGLGSGQRGESNGAEEIAHAVAINRWHNSPNAQFMVLLESGSRALSTYCADNINFSLHGRVYIFTVVPWLGPHGDGCNGPPLTKGYGVTVSHEYAEMVTDPLADAWARGSPTGHNNEIADICAAAARVRGIWVQLLWSNRLHRCAA